MGSLAGFMKTMKQRYSVWYNGERGRVGTLWAERYKSCVVQDSPQVLRVVGAYIELNPVRAGLAERAAAYRWSGYGAAAGGEAPASLRTWARSGIVGMLGKERKEGEGEESRRGGTSLCPGAAGESEEARKFVESYGLLVRVKDDTDREECRERDSDDKAVAPDLMRRIPGFLRGAAVGTRGFISGISGYLGRKRDTPPVVCLDSGGMAAVFQARTQRRRERSTAVDEG